MTIVGADSDLPPFMAVLEVVASLELARLAVVLDGGGDDDGEEWMAETASLSTCDTFSRAVSSPTSSQSPVTASFFRNRPGGLMLRTYATISLDMCDLPFFDDKR